MDKLSFIDEQMNVLAVRYELGERSSAIAYPYWVGEYTEESIVTEDGAEETTMLLTGYTRGKLLDLESDKAKIKNHFPAIFGLRGRTDGGAIAVFFDGAFPVPSGEAGLKKMQINLKIKEWKGVI